MSDQICLKPRKKAQQWTNLARIVPPMPCHPKWSTALHKVQEDTTFKVCKCSHAVQPPDDALVAARENRSKGAVSQSEDLICGILGTRSLRKRSSGSISQRRSSAPRGLGRRARTWPSPCLQKGWDVQARLKRCSKDAARNRRWSGSPARRKAAGRRRPPPPVRSQFQSDLREQTLLERSRESRH